MENEKAQLASGNRHPSASWFASTPIASDLHDARVQLQHARQCVAALDREREQMAGVLRQAARCLSWQDNERRCQGNDADNHSNCAPPGPCFHPVSSAITRPRAQDRNAELQKQYAASTASAQALVLAVQQRDEVICHPRAVARLRNHATRGQAIQSLTLKAAEEKRALESELQTRAEALASSLAKGASD